MSLLKDDILAALEGEAESEAIFFAKQILALQSATGTKQESAYTPGVAGNWSPAPTTIQIALDQLAARVKALEP